MGIAKAIHGMVVDHANGLHKSITDCRADEIEAALFQVFAHRFSFRGFSGDFTEGYPPVDDRFVIYESPDKFIEITKLILDF